MNDREWSCLNCGAKLALGTAWAIANISRHTRSRSCQVAGRKRRHERAVADLVGQRQTRDLIQAVRECRGEG